MKYREMPVKQGSGIGKSGRLLGQRQRNAKMVGAGLYARAAAQDPETLPMQNRAMREYGARRGWNIAIQVKEVGLEQHNDNAGRSCWKRFGAGRSTLFVCCPQGQSDFSSHELWLGRGRSEALRETLDRGLWPDVCVTRILLSQRPNRPFPITERRLANLPGSQS